MYQHGFSMQEYRNSSSQPILIIIKSLSKGLPQVDMLKAANTASPTS